MRDLNECQAEVFRRSEKRIRKRRRIGNCILTLCIPLSITVALWAFAAVSGVFPANEKNMSAGGDRELAGGIAVNKEAPLRLEVVPPGDSKQTVICKEDVNEAARIYDALQSFFVIVEESVKEHSEDNVVTEDSHIYANCGTTYNCSGCLLCRVVFTAENGAQASYMLSGNTLTDEQTGQKAILTEAQRTDLLDMLGLTITWEVDP